MRVLQGVLLLICLASGVLVVLPARIRSRRRGLPAGRAYYVACWVATLTGFASALIGFSGVG